MNLSRRDLQRFPPRQLRAGGRPHQMRKHTSRMECYDLRVPKNIALTAAEQSAGQTTHRGGNPLITAGGLCRAVENGLVLAHQLHRGHAAAETEQR